MHTPSYPSIFALGHRALGGFLFDGNVVVEEKIDGSQFSFGIIDGKLLARSKNNEQNIDAPDKLFQKAIDTIKALEPILQPGFIYRGEYLQKPRHNVIAYDRVPDGNIIIYDIEDIESGMQCFLGTIEKWDEAKRIGLECVPLIYTGIVDSPEQLKRLLPQQSLLGAVQPEGLVVKNYNRFGQDKKILLGKFVTDAFKEVHAGKWGKPLAPKAEIVERLISEYGTPARFQKAVQHLRENGALTDSPKDIGPLMAEVGKDVLKECQEEIAAKLFEHFWKQVSRGITKGVPAWWKEQLAQAAFPAPIEDQVIDLMEALQTSLEKAA